MKARALVSAALALISEPALAHPPPLGIPGFVGGLLHPLLVPAHLFAIVGFGVLAGQQRWGASVPAALLMALVLGLGGIALAFVPQWTGTAVLALAAVSGALLALARPLPRSVGYALAAMTGLSIGFDSPPDTPSVEVANLMLLGTGLGAALLTVTATAVAARIDRPGARIAARVVGSWIAASAILVLAVQWSR